MARSVVVRLPSGYSWVPLKGVIAFSEAVPPKANEEEACYI